MSCNDRPPSSSPKKKPQRPKVEPAVETLEYGIYYQWPIYDDPGKSVFEAFACFDWVGRHDTIRHITPFITASLK